jgi:Transglutaminase-like superfamily
MALAQVRAGWWALRSRQRARRRLRRGPFGDVGLEPPPTLPAPAVRGVTAVLRYRRVSCLERSLIMQRWLAAQGERRDVVIGITGVTEFRAHAWLDGDPEAPSVPFEELARLRP